MKRKWPRRLAILAGIVTVLAVAGYVYLPFLGAYMAGKTPQMSQVAVGAVAPDFSVTGADGKVHRLTDYIGKMVVLEWTSPTCEFTAKHYASGNMQALQKYARKNGLVWLSVNSAGPDKPDYLTAAQATARIRKTGSTVSVFLLDSDGALGRRYGAKTTPSLYLIDGQGVLQYQGAVDDKPWGDGNIATGTNYLHAAVEALIAGKPVSLTTTQPYGCSVHY